MIILTTKNQIYRYCSFCKSRLTVLHDDGDVLSVRCILFLVVLFVGVARAQEDSWTKCDGWNTTATPIKLAYIEGWGSGVAASDLFVEKIISPNYLRNFLWPRGHQAASVMVEIDTKCQLAGNRNQYIAVIIAQIAKEKNK